MLAPRACAAAALTLLLFQHRLPETSALATGASKPNIVFFMADDTGWYNVGWHNKDMLTPNSDQLIKDGIELDRHCTLKANMAHTQPMCGRGAHSTYAAVDTAAPAGRVGGHWGH